MQKIRIEMLSGKNVFVETEETFTNFIKSVNASQMCFDNNGNRIPLCMIEKIHRK